MTVLSFNGVELADDFGYEFERKQWCDSDQISTASWAVLTVPVPFRCVYAYLSICAADGAGV